jgi:hypothetical protein
MVGRREAETMGEYSYTNEEDCCIGAHLALVDSDTF